MKVALLDCKKIVVYDGNEIFSILIILKTSMAVFRKIHERSNRVEFNTLFSTF
ncbi:hypothetical protein T03_18040 [Trichinella britovi]|uniref:Uncharacterized protein n=1 Tax=Trichinella britovi TaxID=45882 RepID=A0A0V1AHR6_TRIBR|nr:hypothetical protein T03_18040 [Trichinella britovi]